MTAPKLRDARSEDMLACFDEVIADARNGKPVAHSISWLKGMYVEHLRQLYVAERYRPPGLQTRDSLLEEIKHLQTLVSYQSFTRPLASGTACFSTDIRSPKGHMTPKKNKTSFPSKYLLPVDWQSAAAAP